MAPTPAELDVALLDLLRASLPGLFGGATPVVRASVVSDALQLDGQPPEPAVGDPRPADQLDRLTFDATKPHGPWQLTRPPYPGPRRVRLLAPAGPVSLPEAEIAWDRADPRSLTLNLKPGRDVSAVTHVEVSYGVTAVFTALTAKRSLGLSLEVAAGDTTRLAGAVDLALAVIELNREQLTESAAISYADGAYGATSSVKRLRVTGVVAPTSTTRLLSLEADTVLRLDRALAADEGAPIKRIGSPGRPADPQRRVDIAVEVDA
jgi:hypothetical protein